MDVYIFNNHFETQDKYVDFSSLKIKRKNSADYRVSIQIT